MLKDKSCYANDRLYAMNYFFHKADVADYCIDPLLGSFIRVVHPPKGMPDGAGDIYTRPQFMFMTRTERSRLYELKEARPLVDAVRNLLQSEKSEYPTRMQVEIAGKLLCESDGEILFKNTDLRFQRMLSSPPSPNRDRGPNNEHLTKERYIQALENLLYGLECALAGEGETREMIIMGNEMSLVMKRHDERVTTPIVITARRFSGHKDSYIVMHSNKQRIIFPVDTAEDMVDRYFTNIIDIAERLAGTGSVGDGEVKFSYPEAGTTDTNMEYVNVRKFDFVSGPAIHAIINSDRVPGNTKFGFIYDRLFATELRTRLMLFARDFKEICAK